MAANTNGHTFLNCGMLQTVNGCFTNRGENNIRDASLDDKFNYGGGHYQALASACLRLPETDTRPREQTPLGMQGFWYVLAVTP